MISLCITGHSAPAITAAHAALVAAGMAPARPLARDAQINFATWHERVYQALLQSQAESGDEADGSDTTEADAAPATMGRFWEQLASDLFLANMDAKIWGWADANSLGLLDFWLDLDASTHFVLLATTPAQYLADQLAQLAHQAGASLQDLPVDSLMDQWQQSHQAMLRFALHHPKRCVLLLADHLPLQTDALVQAVKSTWSRKLKALRTEQPAESSPAAMADAGPGDALLRHFAQELCQAYPQALSLQHEIASVAMALPAPGVAPGVPHLLLDSVLTTVSLAHQVPALQHQMAEIAAAQDVQAQSLAQATAQLDALAQDRLGDGHAAAELQAQLDEAIRAKDQAVADALQQQSLCKAAEEEGELILLQLHQVQEELERYYLNNTQLEADLAAKTQENEEVAALVHARNLLAMDREAEAQAKAHAYEQLDALGQQYQALAAEREAEAQARAHAYAQLDALSQQYQALAAEREAQREAEAQAKAQAYAQLDALGQECQSLAAALDAQTQANAQSQEEIHALVHARNLMAAGREEVDAQALAVKQENDLIFGQLHQVQEELERYYLRNKDLEAAATLSAQRFARMLGRQPDGIDWDLVQADLEPAAGGAQLRCRATQVAVSGKAWDDIEFTARIHDGALAFGFTRGPGQPTVLTRWPRSAAAADRITTTVGPDAVDEDGNSLLKEIGTSDWDLLRGLPRLLVQALQQFKGAWPPGAPAPQAWLDAARATLPALQSHPIALRVDALRLLANRVLAGREYLVLRAEQLSLGNKRVAGLDFRLGCNLGPKGEFGQNARLEFFKGSAPGTFDNWAPNVQDPAGDRLDLVFVFPTSMNLKDWTALSVNDRALVLLLADQLPALLADIQTGDVPLSRRQTDWLALANTLRSFVRQRLDVTGVQQAMPEAVAKDLPLAPAATSRRSRAAKPKPTPPPSPVRASKRAAPATPAAAARGLKK